VVELKNNSSPTFIVGFMQVIKILVIGEGGVGKTTLIHRFVTGEYSDHPMTIGLGFATKTMKTNEGKIVKLQMWDVGGQPRFRLLLPSAKGGARGVILVFDLSRPSTFVKLDDWVRLVRKDLPPTKYIPIILVGAKCDLSRAVMLEAAREFVVRMHLDGYVETSSKTNSRVEEPFTKILRLIIPVRAKLA
jgi:small GTP-binding protein